MEYQYLSNLTNNTAYLNQTQKLRNILKDTPKQQGLYAQRLKENGEWSNSETTLFWQGRDFYDGLVKSYIQTGGRDVEGNVYTFKLQCYLSLLCRLANRAVML